ncbi:proline-rich receptor-like protein kinase PERK2 [Felis catus]|uniref:proline-rich receptor-like protein kinase PERK2 n=1 Tax=Felis catus TaxID=9685 RepID=UPI001D19F89B|nr:proline-rich receptor-like protein kinase PERK2 [Felis catus]
MEKLMSGASMGSRRKRAGIGATESASRPRRGGAVERDEERRLRGGGRATEGSWGLAHSLAGTAAPKQQAEKLPSSSERPTSTRVPETLLPPPPPPPPARAAPPRTSPRAPPPPPPMPPGCFRLEPSANHKRAPESSGSRPRPPFAPPRPSPSPPWVRSLPAGLKAAIPSENSPFFAGLALFWKKKTAWRTCSPYPNLLGPFRPHTKPSYPPCHFAPKRQTRSRDT